MSLQFLDTNNTTELPLVSSFKRKKSWLEWFRLRRRKSNPNDEINEFHELISNVYESMDDQVRAILLSLSKLIQNDDDDSTTIEDKIQAIIAIGHLLCCSHMQIKSSTQLYSKLLQRVFFHQSSHIRLATIIAMAEISIDNLSFQMKLNKLDMISKLFNTMKTSLIHAGRTNNDINMDSKIVAWSCYAIVNICTNCMPNILLLREIIPTELDSLNEAIQLDIWSCIWQENYALIILQFVDQEIISHLISNAVQPKRNLFENIEYLSTDNLPTNHRSLSNRNYQRCTIL